jgi:hypothetical protein
MEEKRKFRTVTEVKEKSIKQSGGTKLRWHPKIRMFPYKKDK